MAEHRAHPPSPRRRALARRAGLHAASPILVGAAAGAAGVGAIAVLGRAAIHRIGQDIAHACANTAAARSIVIGADGIGASGTNGAAPSVGANGAAPSAGAILSDLLAIAMPILALAALAAIAGHLAQTRGVWLPRRRVDHAPSLPAGGGARVRRTALDLIAGGAIAGVGFGWLWWAAPRLAGLLTLPIAAGAVVVSGLAALAIAWLVLGAGDSLLRHAAVATALSMTAAEKREDDRASAADPRWRALRAKLARTEVSSDAIAGATVLILGDGLAVALAWDPIRRPIPHRIAWGRDVRATQLLGLARRFAIPVHREPDLARALVSDLGERASGPVPETAWPRVAEIVAAVRHSEI